MNTRYQYVGDESSANEVVYFDLYDRAGNYDTTCIICPERLLQGGMIHQGADGSEIKLALPIAAEIKQFLQDERAKHREKEAPHMENMRYIGNYQQPGRNWPVETVLIDLPRTAGASSVSCIADVDRLISRIARFPCTDGTTHTLTAPQMIKALEFAKAERDKIRNSGEIKTLDGWNESGLDLYEYLRPGDRVDEAICDILMNNLPPQTMKRGYQQAGGTYSHEADQDGVWRGTYATFIQKDSHWQYCGLCFPGKDVNVVKERDRIAEAIAELKEKGIHWPKPRHPRSQEPER